MLHKAARNFYYRVNSVEYKTLLKINCYSNEKYYSILSFVVNNLIKITDNSIVVNLKDDIAQIFMMNITAQSRGVLNIILQYH